MIVDLADPGSGASGQGRYLPRETTFSRKWPGVPFTSFTEFRGTATWARSVILGIPKRKEEQL